MSKLGILLFLTFSGVVFTTFFVVKYKKPEAFWRKPVIFKIPKEKIFKETLNNGMNLLIIKDTSVPKVLMQIAYDIGSAVEQKGEKGLAHLIEHMIFKGTDKLLEGDIDAIGRKYGATFNAFTSQDVTSYYFEVDSNNWKPFLEILADCMSNARFDSQHLASEVKAVIAELRMRNDSYSVVMWEEAMKLLYPQAHPYYYPIIGFKEDLLNFSSEGLKKFYKKYYHPDRATLFVIGDVDPKEIVEEANKQLGNIGTKSTESYKEVPLGDNCKAAISKIYRDIDHPQIGMFWRIPGRKCKEDAVTEAMECVLGEGEGSRIYKRLVEDDKIADSAGVGSNVLFDSGIFAIVFRPKNGKTEECRKAIVEELNKVIEEGIGRLELDKVIKTKQRSFFEALEDYSHFAYHWIMSYFATRDEFDIFEGVNRMSALQPEDLQKFTKKYLDPSIACELQMLPAPQEELDKLVEEQKREAELDKEILKKQIRTTPLEGVNYVNSMPEPNKLSYSYPKPDLNLTLDNGLKVLLHKNDKLPFLSFNIEFRDASYYVNSNEGIIFDLLMNMLMEGSDGFSKEDNVEFFEQGAIAYEFGAAGISLNLLSEDYTKIFNRLSHIIQKPTFPQDALEKLKAIYISKMQSLKKKPMKVALRKLKSIIYEGHPFSWNYDDAIQAIKNVTVNDLLEFHKKYLIPCELIVSAAGQFDLNEIQNSITKAFSSLRGEKLPERKVLDQVSDYTPQKQDIYMVRDQVALVLGQLSPLDAYSEDLIPIKMLNLACFLSLGSRLYQIREATGAFYSSSASFAAHAGRDLGFDYIVTLLNPENLDKVEKQLLDMVKEIATNGITQDELEVSRKIYLKSLIDMADKNGSVASVLLRLESLNLGFDYYDKNLERVQSITLDEINQVAKKYLNTEKMHRVRVGRVGK